MTAHTINLATQDSSFQTHWLELVEQLGRQFAERSQQIDASDRFVFENYSDLKAHGFVSLGVPQAFGGAGLNHAQLCEVLHRLGQYCGSTALAFAMHTHQVTTAAWRWEHQNAPVEGLLKRVANGNIIILSSGGSDWLEGSGQAERVEGGFVINARKVFASGSPVGDLLMTSAIYDDPDAGATVLHFAVPMSAPGVAIESTWRALGMRGTGSHDITLSNVFVADAGIAGKRPQGKWHPLFHTISMIAFPLVYSVYVGVAQAARDCTLEHVKKRPQDSHLAYLVGGLENELTAAHLALKHMIAVAASNQPGLETTNQIMTGRALVARAVLNVVEMAMEATGGTAFYRSKGIEQLFRDAQGVRYHPLRDGDQRRLSGQLALNWTVDHT
ncbi:acyl-CoA dehydrogenase family protein [Leptolyngbya sp. FACHB-541]|uniref:acyl-CoA dehydrogenase family protein n=1 Tax=Leptolyngbya sp. FACHB-541 TaxID=2692810 RepID=UPI001685C043|nr:acyl-CoA dehydrogenase family protein [Leptolyngbya sp. FACHB-541]MBD1997231.1 acyl-CoA dehydrogenase family protein [Leptolyngbya sp. FACHB-541]